MRWPLIALLCISAPVVAQISYPPSATQADIATAITAATPAPCSTPLPDTLTGSAGTGSPCMARPDATRPTQVQPVRTTSAADGTWSATWPQPFLSTPTYGHAEVLGGSQPYTCDVLALSTTGVTGKCYALVPTTIPGSLTAIYGLVVSPVANPGAGLIVMVVGRQ